MSERVGFYCVKQQPMHRRFSFAELTFLFWQNDSFYCVKRKLEAAFKEIEKVDEVICLGLGSFFSHLFAMFGLYM